MTTREPSDDGGRFLLGLLAVLFLVYAAYAVLIAQQLLFVPVVALLLVAAYVFYRLVVAVERVADGVHRAADALEAEE